MSLFTGKHTTQREDVAVNNCLDQDIRVAIERLEGIIGGLEENCRENEGEIRDLKTRLADAQDIISRIQT